MKNNFEIKNQLYSQCVDFIENRLGSIKSAINDIHQSLNSETKNTSVDKHETGRAMLQIDLEKASNQLAEIKKIKNILKKIDTNKSLETVCLGSVVCTTKSNYFIAISAGAMIADGQPYYAIATDTPIGQLLVTKRTCDEIVFRNEIIKIKSVF